MIQRIRWMRSHSTVPYGNLALEEVLLDRAVPGEVMLYLWQNRRTVVIGRNQNPWRECRVEALEGDGGFLARRRSGGGAVFHDLGNLNFTFVARHPDYHVARQLGVVTAALARLGVDAQPRGRNDLCVGERKISGNAFQNREDRGCHHGTLMLDVDLDALGCYLSPSADKLRSKGVASVRSRVVNLRELCPGVTVDQLCGLLVQSFGEEYRLTPEELTPGRLDAASRAQLESTTAFYASWDWRLGRPIPFTQELTHRFPWGEVQLQLQVTGGRVGEAAAFSDALDPQLFVDLPAALRGCPYEADALAARVASLGTAGQAPMARDLAQLLGERLSQG